MKILLTAVNAKYIHSNPAVYSLAAYAGEYLHEGEKQNCEIQIREFTINHSIEAILAEIYKDKPDVVGFSCYIWNWSYIRELMTDLHKLLPHTHIILGGPEVSYTAYDLLEAYPFVKGIIIGEGEESFLQLCRYYSKAGLAGNLPDIKGVVTPENKETVNACCRKEEDTYIDMSKIPFLYKEMDVFNHRIVYYESSRGCPYSCSYCLSSLDKRLRFRDLSLVKEELSFFLENKIPQVKFIDRTFNAKREHSREIWKFILENDNGITNFHFEISAHILQDEDMEILSKMRPGLVQFEIGIQSVNEDTILAVNRAGSIEKIRENVKKIHELYNIHQHLDLIAGLPFENYESFRHSFDEVYYMEPNQLQLGFLKVLKGSPIWKKAEEFGIIYRENPPYEVLYTKWISYDEIRKLKAVEEMVEIYYNSGQFTYTMAVLLKEFHSPFEMYERLAQFYEDNGYMLQSPARSYRYKILLDFCDHISYEKHDMYVQLLIYDTYLREKVKTRPQFAPDQEEMKEVSRILYKKEEEERQWLPEYKEFNSKQMAKMTHLEEVSYSVWQRGDCKKLTNPALILFNYKKRNPLTKEAETIFIDGSTIK